MEYPVGIDDEYWETPDPITAWKQPSDKPALADCSRLSIRLLEILAFTLRAVVRFKLLQRFNLSDNNTFVVLYAQITNNARPFGA